MIKVFNPGTTVFNTNGLGACIPISCIETHRSGLTEWYIDVEVDTKYIDLIQTNNVAVVNTKNGPQAFTISNPEIGTTIKFTAKHIVFTAANYILDDVRPTDKLANDFLKYINERTDIPSPFNVSSNVSKSQTKYFVRENLLEAFNVTNQIFGGEFKISNYTIELKENINVYADFRLLYGKNIEGLTKYENWDNVVTKILPVGPEGLLLPEKYIESKIDYGIPYTKVIEFEIESKNEQGNIKSESEMILELRTLATQYINENQYPLLNYTLQADTPQNIDIGYVIDVKHPNASFKTEVMAYTYNCNSKRVETIEFGNYERSAKKEFSNFKNTITADVKKALTNNAEFLVKAKEDVNNILNTGGKDGAIYFKTDEKGIIKEIYGLDSNSIETAKTIMRFNNQGLAGTTNGIDGPYNSAVLANGEVVADAIKTGTLQGVRIICNSGDIGGLEVGEHELSFSAAAKIIRPSTSEYIDGEMYFKLNSKASEGFEDNNIFEFGFVLPNGEIGHSGFLGPGSFHVDNASFLGMSATSGTFDFLYSDSATFKTLNQSSLETLKKDIKVYDALAMKEIKDTTVYEYKFKDSNHPNYGFVIGENRKLSKHIIAEDKKSINLYSATALLYKAMQEIDKRIQKLEEVKK